MKFESCMKRTDGGDCDACEAQFTVCDEIVAFMVF